MKRSKGCLHHPAAPVSELLLPQQNDEPNQHDPPHDRKRQRREKQQKKKNDNEEESMLIFGYEARIFNDKEAAKRVEKGHYLIPWQSNPDTRYKMDRYDVRHMLEDLSKELSYNHHMATTTHSDREKEQDELCNNERYADLDSEEELLFDMSEDEREAHVDEKRREREKKEEESKFHAFDYDGKNKEEKDRSDIQNEIASEYKAPEDMIVPSTREQATIISDTAKAASASVNPNLFEIKTHARQANNPLYAFLSKRHELYPFYKHLSWLLSSGLGAYGDSSDSEDDDSEDDNQKNNNDNDTTTSNKQEEDHNHHDAISNSNPTQKEKEVSPPKMDQGISTVIDKTARFVARAGPDLEQKIRQRHAHDPKFAFLYRNNQYHEYYQSKINYFKANPNA
ncbi:alternative splicing regulator-domain-containing protein, partial [Phascolomyces articulosus]